MATSSRTSRSTSLSDTQPQVQSPYPPAPEPPPPPAVVNRLVAGRSNIIFFFCVILALTLGFKLLKELEILYVSALFAVVLMPSVNWISAHGIGSYKPGRAVAIVILLLSTFLILGLFITIAVPPVLRDLHSFVTELPQRLPGFIAHVKRLPLANKLDVDTAATKAEGVAGSAGAFLLSSLPLWLAHIFDILTAVFLCIYFMLEGENAYDFFLSICPAADRRRLDLTLKKAEVKMSKWLFGQGLLMLVLGVTSTIVFGFMHVRYFVLFGVLMGLLNIIPIAGGVVTIVIVAAVAAVDSWAKMAGVFAFYAIYMNIENAFLTPRIMKSSVDLMGLTVLVALLLGTALAGIVGALVAVPTAALISVLLEEYAVQRLTDAGPAALPRRQC